MSIFFKVLTKISFKVVLPQLPVIPIIFEDELSLIFLEISVKDLVDYIDWTPFFNAWGFKSSYPKILKDKKMNNEANKLFEDANNLLNKIIQENWFNPKGTIGFFKANSSAS